MMNDRPVNVSTEHGYANLTMHKIAIKNKRYLKRKTGTTLKVWKAIINELQGFEAWSLTMLLYFRKYCRRDRKAIMDCLNNTAIKADIFGFGTAFHRHYPKVDNYEERLG